MHAHAVMPDKLAEPPHKRPRTDLPQGSLEQQQQQQQQQQQHDHLDQQLHANQGQQKRKAGSLWALIADDDSDEDEAGNGGGGAPRQLKASSSETAGGPQAGAMQGAAAAEAGLQRQQQQQRTQQTQQQQQAQQQQHSQQHQQTQQHKQALMVSAHEQTLLPRAAAPLQQLHLQPAPHRVSAYFSQEPSQSTPCQATVHKELPTESASQQQHLLLPPNTQEQAFYLPPGSASVYPHPHALRQATSQRTLSQQGGGHSHTYTQPFTPQQHTNGGSTQASAQLLGGEGRATQHARSLNTERVPGQRAASQQQSLPATAAAPAAAPAAATLPSPLAEPPHNPPPPPAEPSKPNGQSQPRTQTPQQPSAPQTILARLAGPLSGRASKPPLTAPSHRPQPKQGAERNSSTLPTAPQPRAEPAAPSATAAAASCASSANARVPAPQPGAPPLLPNKSQAAPERPTEPHAAAAAAVAAAAAAAVSSASATMPALQPGAPQPHHLPAPPSAPPVKKAAPPPSSSSSPAAAAAEAPMPTAAPLTNPAPATTAIPSAHTPAAPPPHLNPYTTHSSKPAPTTGTSLHTHTATPPHHHATHGAHTTPDLEPALKAAQATATDSSQRTAQGLAPTPAQVHHHHCTTTPVPPPAQVHHQCTTTPAPPLAQVPLPPPGLTVVQTLPQLCALLQHVRAARRFGFALHFRAMNSRDSSHHSGGGPHASPHHQHQQQQQHQERPQEVVQGIAVSVEDRGCYYVCVPGDACMQRCREEGPQVLQGLQELLTDPRVTKASYKLKQQHQQLSGQSAFRVRAPLVDVWLCLYLRDPGTLSSLPASMGCQVLEQQLARYAGSGSLAQIAQGLPSSRSGSAQGQHLSGPSVSSASFSPSSGPGPTLSPGYLDALKVAALSRKLYDVLYPGLKKDGMLKALTEIEMPLVPILARMEARGMCCDPTTLVRQQVPLQQRIDQLERIAWKAAGMQFHLNSPKQVSETLFDRLKLKPPKGCVRNKSGYLGTSAEVLQEMQGQHPVVDALIEHRQLGKQCGLMKNLLETLAARSAHMQRIITLANAQAASKNGSKPVLPRISGTNIPVPGHPSLARLQGTFNQAGTATGRLTVDNPNLQTVPKPCEYQLNIAAPGGPEQQQRMEVNMRAAFVATPGHVLLAVDYSQVELRLMAHFCGDPQLCHSMREEEPDPFKPIAAMWLRCSRDEVTPEQRNQAKKMTYAVLYGLGPFGLAQQLKVDVKTAWALIISFQQSLPNLMAWMERIVEDCRKDGYITMLSGRRRYLPHIRSTDQSARAAAERQAINSVVQGSAADLIKRGMVLLDSLLRDKMDGAARLVLQVHDELLFEVKVGREQQVAALVSRAMSGAWKLRVPFPVKLSLGPSWGELQEM